VLTLNNIESELSYAYLHAVASRAGLICEVTGRHSDDAGVDAVLRVRGRLAQDSILTQFTADVQLKATRQPPVLENDRFQYRIKRKNYDDLRSTMTGAPQLLIVLYLPDDETQWLEHDEDRLLARKCAYWGSLREAPEIDQGSQVISIPKSNVLSVDGLRDLMTRLSKNEVINYAP
jgi:hypothetical protein